MKTEEYYVVYSFKGGNSDEFTVFQYNRTRQQAEYLVRNLKTIGDLGYFMQPQRYGKEYGESLKPCNEIHKQLYP